jgi:L-fuculose-phosphate aldolase
VIPPLARTALVQMSKRMHAAGWVANHDGNASIKVGRDRYLITATATSKADVTESTLVLVDGAGKVVEGTKKPPGELELHLAAYRARPDISAVLHAHPPNATAFGVAGIELDPLPLPEAVVSLGKVTLQPLAIPKSPQAIECVARGVTQGEAVLLAGNGALTVGPDLALCFLRMELVEHVANITLLARRLGGAQPIPEAAYQALLTQHRKAFPRS